MNRKEYYQTHFNPSPFRLPQQSQQRTAGDSLGAQEFRPISPVSLQAGSPPPAPRCQELLTLPEEGVPSSIPGVVSPEVIDVSGNKTPPMEIAEARPKKKAKSITTFFPMEIAEARPKKKAKSITFFPMEIAEARRKKKAKSITSERKKQNPVSSERKKQNPVSSEPSSVIPTEGDSGMSTNNTEIQNILKFNGVPVDDDRRNEQHNLAGLLHHVVSQWKGAKDEEQDKAFLRKLVQRPNRTRAKDNEDPILDLARGYIQERVKRYIWRLAAGNCCLVPGSVHR